MGRTLYSIRDWEDHFEVSQSKRIEGQLSWVALPTKHDGLGYQRVVRTDPALYAAWVLIVQVAAKCPTRGVLADENGPLDSEDLSLKTGVPSELFDRALKLLTSERVGWITKSVLGDVSETTPSTGHNSTRQNIDSPNGESCSEHPAKPDISKQVVLVFPCVGKGPQQWNLLQSKLEEYQESFPGIDVLAECRAALQWCRDNATKRKTYGGMAAFLGRWLTNGQNKSRANPPQKQKSTTIPKDW